MPLYEYRCPQCEHRFEARHSMTADKPDCPACGFSDVQRVISRAPSVNAGMVAHAGDGHSASKAQLRDKWSEETPKLRKKLEDKLGRDTVRQNAPSLYMNTDD